MAAISTTATPPPQSPSSNTSSPSRRKPVPLPKLSPQEFGWDGNKSFPPVPLNTSARIKRSPVSPVRVDFQPGTQIEPSNANIEYVHTTADAARHSRPSSSSSLPRTPTSATAARSPTRLEDSPSIRSVRDSTLSDDALPLRIAKSRPTATHGSPLRSTTNSRGTLLSGSEITNGGALDAQAGSRDSRDTDTTTSSNKQLTSAESSVATSASSVSGANENSDYMDPSQDTTPATSVESGISGSESVPQLQYHHQPFIPRTASMPLERDARTASTPNLQENAGAINRHLTPNSNFIRRSSMPRPQSSYSLYSDGSRSQSPGYLAAQQMRAASASRRSPDVRNSTYAEMLNVPYPQPAPAPISTDNGQLRNVVGANASLLSTQKTLDMYRQNVKKTNDYGIQYSFAIFLISTAQELGFDPEDPKRKASPKPPRDTESVSVEAKASSPHDLVREARSILQRLSNGGYPFAQYYLADGYASGLFSKGKEDYNSAFPLFVLAAKHGHAESAYRTALCYEYGWGCRKDPAKAVQFLRSAASKRHPGAMTRLGKACLSGDLGEKRYREGIKWLKLATESADAMYNAAPYQLGCLYETGYGDDIFLDESYAAELFTQSADLGHPEANFRMGEAYEHGKLNCPRDPALSVHFYTGAAERGHAGAMMGLCAWYMVGAEPILERDEEEAYEWARRSAELGFVKAQYAVGYFTEMGIGCRRDILEANVWYVKAADAGDDRAKQRLAAIRVAVSGGTPMEVGPPRNGKIRKNGDKEESCVVM